MQSVYGSDFVVPSAPSESHTLPPAVSVPPMHLLSTAHFFLVMEIYLSFSHSLKILLDAPLASPMQPIYYTWWSVSAQRTMRVGLDLELCGVVREVTPGDVVPRGAAPAVTRLRDSHHAAARLIARGLNETEISHITGYALSRISSLKRDPLFAELVDAYRLDQRDTQRDLEAMWLGVAADYGQHIHEQLLDNPDGVPIGVALDVFKAFADRAGMSPVTRSVNNNLNVNIGDRLDRARSRVRTEPLNAEGRENRTTEGRTIDHVPAARPREPERDGEDR
jgi:hypothetical protein